MSARVSVFLRLNGEECPSKIMHVSMGESESLATWASPGSCRGRWLPAVQLTGGRARENTQEASLFIT